MAKSYEGSARSWKYDIIFIEPSYWHVSHSDNDIECLVSLTTKIGYEVAVVALNGNSFHNGKGYDVIEIPKCCDFPKIDYVNAELNKIKRFLKRIILDYRRFKYFKKLFNDLDGLAGNYYLGILSLSNFSTLLLFVTSQKKLFLWGIRSYYLSCPKKYTKKNPYRYLKAILLRLIVKAKKNIYLFVSNPMIAEEFYNLGVERNRLIMRPERIIKEKPVFNLNHLPSRFSILSIGSLRPIKNIEFAIESIIDLGIQYTIAGQTSNSYAKHIDSVVSQLNSPHVNRISRYLTNKEYHDIMCNHHFVLICDKADMSVASNGTFFDALLNSRPVIVPDREPFRYYLEKYKVGLMFKDDSKKSLNLAIKNAESLGVRPFLKGIAEFQDDHKLDRVAGAIRRKIPNLNEEHSDRNVS